MTYTYTEYIRGKPIKFSGNYYELKQYLIEYCKNHKKNNVVNISRDFEGIVDEEGMAYTAICKFDRDYNLKFFKIEKTGASVNIICSHTPKYELTRKIRMRDATDFFVTRDEMLRYIKACPNYKFVLKEINTQKKFDVMYIPEKGLNVDGKMFKV